MYRKERALSWSLIKRERKAGPKRPIHKKRDGKKGELLSKTG